MIKIAHISDIHWRPQQRHEEYVSVFENLYEQLRNEKIDAIVCTGDIYHSKTKEITPEVIDNLIWMFKSLSAIAPLHMILGNHDGDITNENRKDAISPIVNAINMNLDLFLYKKSGIYPLILKNRSINNCNLYVYSLFDKENWNLVEPTENSNIWNIALFHGSVIGCETDTGQKLTDCDLNVNFFEKYDLVFLGDIHRTQFLGYRINHEKKNMGWIGYPGSLIQQNYGELERRGWFLWELGSKQNKEWKCKFRPIVNPYPFVTFEWKNNVADTISHILSERSNNIKNHRIRIATKQNLTNLEINELQKILKEDYDVKEVVFKQEKQEVIGTVKTETVTITKHSLRNDTETVFKLYRTFLDMNKEKFLLNEEQIKKGELLIDNYIKNLKQNSDEEIARDVIWNIKKLEFDNLYCYGEGNKIDFQNLNGIVGIFGPNRIGKSSIIGSLMYCLFNTTDRESVKSAHIVNKKKKEGSAKAVINVDGIDYLISRKTVKTVGKRKKIENEDKSTTSLELYRLNFDGNNTDLINENDIKRSDTDKIIRRLIGSSDDFLITAFSNQGGINRFIEAGNAERKEILNRFLDIDIFKKLHIQVNEDYKKIEAKTIGHNPAVLEKEINNLKNEINQLKFDSQNDQIIISNLRKELENKKIWIHDNENMNQTNLIVEFENISKKLKQLQKTKEITQNEILRNESEKKEIDKKINNLNESIINEKNEIEQLQKAIEKIKEMEQLLNDLNVKKNENSIKLEQMKKSVEKLSIVPCGDKYPNCPFIKDSHIYKDKLKEEEQSVETLNKCIAAIKEYLNNNEKKEYEKNLNLVLNRKNELNSLKIKNDYLIKEHKLLITDLEKTNEEIKELENKYSKIEAKINLTNQKEYEVCKEEIKNIEKQINYKENDFNQKLIKIGINESKIEQLEKTKKQLEELNEELKVYESVREAFAKNGLPTLVLKTQLPIINMELEKILSGIVDFKIFLETESGGTNNLEIYIDDKHSKRLIELASGMEKTIASFALRIALLGLSSLPKPNIFICDEGFEYLDSDGIIKCLNLLSSIKDRFKAIIIITHIPEIKEIADKIIEIKNINGDAFVQV
jgi:DNA repair exonuclease SbcCD ATPase subunit/DNA repair exonuclease SbcCD nuclease subunit